MGETKLSPLPCPAGIPEWMWREVSEYDLPLTFTPRTVLDIGANIGAFTLLAVQRWPDVEITAIEPMPDNLDLLWRNVPASSNIRFLAGAVRSFSGHDEIFIGDRGVTCGFHQIGRQTKETKSVRCIDAATLASAEFVKIDTEGSEVEILERLNLADTKVLCVEYHRVEDAQTLSEIAHLAGLETYAEKPLGPTWGLLVFARPGYVAASPAPRPTPHAPKVFLALPVYGGLDVHFTQCLIKLITAPPCELALRMNPGDSLVSRSRNTLTADFLESDASHLLFIDTDLIFSGEQIERLLSHDKDIVAGFYPKKQEGPVQWVCNAHLDEQPVQTDGLQRVRYMGTGFLLVKRRVFERMMALYPELAFKPDHRDRVEYDFWSVGPYRYIDGYVRYLSEDWYFCQRALDAGFDVWGDTKVVLKHVGQAIYPLRSQEAELFSGVTPGNGAVADAAIRPSAPPPPPSRAEAHA